MKNRLLRTLFWAVCSLFILAGCAKVMPLTGGDEDRQPPRVKSASPDTFSVNFTGKSVIIRFDEYVTLKDPTREIFISPPPQEMPEYLANGQSVKIKFKDSLKKDITYIINFGKSLADITEGNVNTGYSFVFSTGSFIDSASISGNINDAFTGKPQESYKVMLYEKVESDSFPYKEKPLYVVFSDAGGAFKFQNLRAGSYTLFALREENNNYVYDRPGEGIAFISERVNTIDSTFIQLLGFVENKGGVVFQKAKSISPVRTEFYFGGRADSVQIIPVSGFRENSFSKTELNNSGDTLVFWHSPLDADSIVVRLEGAVKDTLTIRVSKTNKPLASAGGAGKGQGRKGGGTPAALMRFSAAGNLTADRYTMPYFQFAEPVLFADTSKIRVLEDSIPVAFSLVSDSLSGRLISLNLAKTGKGKYTLITDSAAFGFISGKVSDKSSTTFLFRPASDYGAIEFIYQDSTLREAKIWQLLKNDKQIAEKYSDADVFSVKFDRLEPGNYQLRMVVDSNKNKKWDTGNFLNKVQPEKILYMTQPAELKAGWDSQIIWKLNPGKFVGTN